MYLLSASFEGFISLDIYSYLTIFTALLHCLFSFFFYLNRVINGTNLTTTDEHMWLIPFTEGQDHLLTIDFGQCTPLIGLRVWNYNKSTDDSFRGVRNVITVQGILGFRGGGLFRDILNTLFLS